MRANYRSRQLHRALALLVAMLAFAWSAGLAAAHSTTVVSSDPGSGAILAHSPALVRAKFADELISNRSTMIVVDANGNQVSSGQGRLDLDDPDHVTLLADLPAALPDGPYIVRWHALLTDGDATDGTFTFTIRAGAPPELATPPATAAPTATPTPAPTALPLPTVGAGRAGPPTDLPLATGKPYEALSWLAAGAILLVGGVGLVLSLRDVAR